MSTGKRTKLGALFVLGFILLNFPFIYLFGKDYQVWGIPLLYFYIFVVWLVLILLVMKLSGKSKQD